MKKYLFILFFAIDILISCSEKNTLPNPEVGFEMGGQLYKSTSSLNVYSLEASPTGLTELGIHIFIKDKDLLLFCTTENLEGTFDNSNSINGELYNRIGLCDEINSIYCKTTAKCVLSEFKFTVERQKNNSNLLEGVFEGIVCNEKGEISIIKNGFFKNLKLYPPCCE